MPKEADKAIDINELSIKEVELLVGQQIVDMRVENKWIVCVFGNNTAVKIKRK